MKNIGFREGIEFIGVLSIVASLIYVGLELRQAEQTAANDRSLVRVGLAIDLLNGINEYPDIWAKGNIGENLNTSEMVVYENLIENYWNEVGALALTGERLGREVRLNPAVVGFTKFLYENPGARATWLRTTEAYDRYWDFLTSQSQPIGSSANQIIVENLQRLDSDFEK